MKTRLLAFFALVVIGLGSCARPQALQYKGVDRVFLGSVSTTGLQLGMDLKLFNPNNYDMLLKGADLNAFINGRPAGKANLLSSTTVPANDSFTLPVTIGLDVSNILGNALDILTQKEVGVRLEGTVRAGKGNFAVPVKVRYEGRQKIKF
jgi:LEA14-like dessication related protein